MTLPARRRGRPKGTGIDDSTILARIAALMAADPALKPTTAIKRAGVKDSSAVRRLREKLKDAPVASAVKKLAVAAAFATSPKRPGAGRRTGTGGAKTSRTAEARRRAIPAFSLPKAETPPPRRPAAQDISRTASPAIHGAPSAPLRPPEAPSAAFSSRPATPPPTPPPAPPNSQAKSPATAGLPFPAFPSATMFGPLIQLGLSTASALMKAHSQMFAAMTLQHPLAAAIKQQNELMAELIRALDRHAASFAEKK